MAGLGLALQVLGKSIAFGGQLYAGYAQSTEAKMNARLKEQEAGYYYESQGIQWYQDTREINRAISTSVQRTAKSGIEFSGSPLTSTLTMATQMAFDRDINQWNLKIKQSTAEAEKSAYYKQASMAKKQAWFNAFSSLLS